MRIYLKQSTKRLWYAVCKRVIHIRARSAHNVTDKKHIIIHSAML